MSSGSKNLRIAKSISTTPATLHAVAKKFPIVDIGARGGGLEAFTQLLDHLPPDSGMAFVLVQHLPPDHPSQLSNLLSKATSMPVLEVKDGMTVKPNHVFVIPPNKNLDLAQGKLRISPRGDSRVAYSVDHFFNSLAEVHEHCAIGVILSGQSALRFFRIISCLEPGLDQSLIGCRRFVLAIENVNRKEEAYLKAKSEILLIHCPFDRSISS
jgi:chemotaxis response regulator CheB